MATTDVLDSSLSDINTHKLSQPTEENIQFNQTDTRVKMVRNGHSWTFKGLDELKVD